MDLIANVIILHRSMQAKAAQTLMYGEKGYEDALATRNSVGSIYQQFLLFSLDVRLSRIKKKNNIVAPDLV
jgi:hypothetical protein